VVPSETRVEELPTVFVVVQPFAVRAALPLEDVHVRQSSASDHSNGLVRRVRLEAGEEGEVGVQRVGELARELGEVDGLSATGEVLVPGTEIPRCRRATAFAGPGTDGSSSRGSPLRKFSAPRRSA
jgi:hypothetical protein